MILLQPDNQSRTSNGEPAGAQKLVNAIGASLSNLKLSLPKRDPKQKPPEPPSKQDVQRTPPQGQVYEDEAENNTGSPAHVGMGNSIGNHTGAAAKVCISSNSLYSSPFLKLKNV